MPQAGLPVLEARHTPSQPQKCEWGRKGSRFTKKGHAPDRVTDTALMAEQLEHTTACILACLELCLRGLDLAQSCKTFRV